MESIASVGLENLTCTALGVFAAWYVKGVGEIQGRFLRATLEEAISNRIVAAALELAIVIAVGTALSVVLIQPQTVQHSIAAGLGWTD